jgi:hypothetical protein
MTNYTYTVRLVLIILAALALASPAVAGERPFKARANGEFVIEDGGLTVNFEETGLASHLGRYYAAGVFTFAGFNGDGTLHFTASAVYTAANGDKLYTVGTADVDLTTGITIGEDTFVGGTGRFAEATGMNMFVSVTTGPTTYRSVINGTLSY